MNENPDPVTPAEQHADALREEQREQREDARDVNLYGKPIDPEENASTVYYMERYSRSHRQLLLTLEDALEAMDQLQEDTQVRGVCRDYLRVTSAEVRRGIGRLRTLPMLDGEGPGAV